MRVYLPATANTLRRLVGAQHLGPAPLTGFAVTPAMREWYLDDELEELEYAASRQAARASLRLLDADVGAPRRRAVLAIDVPDGDVTIRDDLDRGVVQVGAPVPLAAVASAHIDDADAEAAVTAAASAILAADLGDVQAEETVDDADAYELAWYATQELAVLLDRL
jgi:hypothetical protein